MAKPKFKKVLVTKRLCYSFVVEVPVDMELPLDGEFYDEAVNEVDTERYLGDVETTFEACDQNTDAELRLEDDGDGGCEVTHL